MKKLFSHELFWVTLFSFILISLSLYPLYYHFKITPVGSVYLAQHNSILDFPMFISEIRQGQEGHLTQIQRLTSEVQVGTWVHLFYLSIGWITEPFHLNPIFVYHASRVVIGFLLLLTFYYFLKQFFKDKFTSVCIFFLTAFAAGFPRIKFDQGRFWLIDWPYMQFFSGYDVLRRVTFLPHGMMRDVLFLGVLIFWMKLWETKKIKFFWWAVLCGFFLGFFSPTHALVLYVVFTVYCLLPCLPAGRLSVKLTLAYIILTLPSSLYITWVFDNTVWKVVKDWEASQWFPIPWSEYALGTGPLFFLAGIGIIYFGFNFLKNNILSFRAKSRNPAKRVINGESATFGLDPSTRPSGSLGMTVEVYFLLFIPLLTLFFLFSPFAKTIGLLNFRFLGIPLQVFWGTLGGLTLVWLAKKVSSKINYKLAMIILCLLVFLPTLPSYAVSLKTQNQEFNPPINFNIYPNKKLYDGLLWLEKNTKPEEIVFSDITLGNLIPAYSGNMVYVGHSVSTINYQEKLLEVAKFYKTGMSPDDARKLLLDRRIKYVVWSYDEHGHQGEPQKYASFLTLRFSNSEIQIYEVK